MDIGPVEYLILGFPGDHFKNEIVPALAKLIDSGTVRIINLVFILKDKDGDVTTFEFDQLEELAPFSTLDGEVSGLITREDIDYAADSLEPGTSAAVLLWEDTWPTEFAEAVRGAGGVMLEGARIPADLLEAAVSADSAAVDLPQNTREPVMPLRRTRGLARTVGRTAVIAGTATAVSGHVAQRQAARAQQSQAPVTPAGAPSAPGAVQVDVVDQLKRFAELRDQGILTDEEFAAQKAKLLGS